MFLLTGDPRSLSPFRHAFLVLVDVIDKLSLTSSTFIAPLSLLDGLSGECVPSLFSIAILGTLASATLVLRTSSVCPCTTLAVHHVQHAHTITHN